MAQIHPGRPTYSGLAEQRMHSSCKRAQAGAAPAAGSILDGDHNVRAAFGSVKTVARVRIPLVSPLSFGAQGKVVEPSVCKTELPGASPGCASISGPSSNSRTTQWHCVDRGAIPRGSTFFIGHEEDSNPRRSDRRDTRGSTEVPDHFKFRQSVGSDARRWYRRETGATPVGGSYCPVAQQQERPALTREVDGANPSGAATF